MKNKYIVCEIKNNYLEQVSRFVFTLQEAKEHRDKNPEVNYKIFKLIEVKSTK